MLHENWEEVHSMTVSNRDFLMNKLEDFNHSPEEASADDLQMIKAEPITQLESQRPRTDSIEKVIEPLKVNLNDLKEWMNESKRKLTSFSVVETTVELNQFDEFVKVSSADSIHAMY